MSRVVSRSGIAPSLMVIAAGLVLAGCGGGTKLDSQSFRNEANGKINQAVANTPLAGLVPAATTSQITDCIINKLRGEGYKTKEDVPKDKGNQAVEACIGQFVGVGSDVFRQAVANKLKANPATAAKAEQLADCLDSKLSENYKGQVNVPQAVTQQAGAECGAASVPGAASP